MHKTECIRCESVFFFEVGKINKLRKICDICITKKIRQATRNWRGYPKSTLRECVICSTSFEVVAHCGMKKFCGDECRVISNRRRDKKAYPKRKKTLILRAKRRKGFPPLDWPEMTRFLRTAKPPCALCACSYNKKFQADHLIPLAMGGDNSKGNFQGLCKPCHQWKTKGDVSHIAEWKRLVKESVV